MVGLLCLICRSDEATNLGSVGFYGNDVNTSSVLIEMHGAFAQGEQSVVLAHANVTARMPLGAALTSEDVTCKYSFATEFLDTAALSGGIASVAAGPLTLLMSHDYLLRQF